MARYSLQEAHQIAGGIVIGKGAEEQVLRWAYDSRLPLIAQGTCFLALQGAVRSGAEWVNDLQRYWVVDDVLEAIQKLATHARLQFEGQVLAITGSNAKTIVKEWLYHLLRAHRDEVYRSPGSFNSQLGVALSLLVLPKGAPEAIAIIEAGISEAGEMEKLQSMIQPTAGLFTNLGSAHDAGFESRQHKASEKWLLFSKANWVLYQKENMSSLFETAPAWLEKHGAALYDWSYADASAAISIELESSTQSDWVNDWHYQSQIQGLE